MKTYSLILAALLLTSCATTPSPSNQTKKEYKSAKATGQALGTVRSGTATVREVSSTIRDVKNTIWDLRGALSGF
ncbi:MAG: hypothetical protein ACRCV6_05875 [Formosimonas sp.]